jgi:hypothetical protein
MIFFYKNLKIFSLGNIMEINGNDFTPKKNAFYCEKCLFTCSKFSDWKRHNNTKKHNHRKDGNNLENSGTFCSKNAKKNAKIFCDCGKSYSTKSGMWKHKKSCCVKSESVPSIINNDKDIKLLTNLILEVVKQNNDLANKIVDICKTGKAYNTVNSNNVISNNNTNHFNLNVFLNEKCKDAMNINDFVESIQLDLADLESVGKLGYVDGISSIIVKNLKALDITERPIHCADKKREVIYIKDENKWEKEDDDKKRLKRVIKKVAYKNERLLPHYKQKYPDYNDSESSRSDQFSKIIIEAMGGAGDNDAEKEEKILKKIAKEVVIDKTINYID